ncbi:MAG: hypothetical protein DHS20C01_34230 [marine bacterium B5-7]|nr:MAG: hypothetical protein DHS20C01_34230 [marine bacterium B5-7]
MPSALAIKVDVDTEVGTRIGVPNLLRLFDRHGIAATFLFSLGPDNTGRAIKRIFRRGFFTKVIRSDVVGMYGMRTLLNGVLWPGPHIGKRHAALIRSVRDAGHEVGIHCYDHVYWQDNLFKMNRDQVFAEFEKANTEFKRIFSESAHTAGAAGWQTNAYSLEAYELAGIEYASDTRGTHAYYPRVGNRIFNTLQIPTTLPTLDELLASPTCSRLSLGKFYLSSLRPDDLNVLTIHAEIEGMNWIEFFRRLLTRIGETGFRLCRLQDLAVGYLTAPVSAPVCDIVYGNVDGRAGMLAIQGTM